MEDAARGFAERNQRWSLWAGRVGSLVGAYLTTGGWRTPPGPPRTGSWRLGSGRNGGRRARSCDC
jgi:hypothetical protein